MFPVKRRKSSRRCSKKELSEGIALLVAAIRDNVPRWSELAANLCRDYGPPIRGKLIVVYRGEPLYVCKFIQESAELSRKEAQQAQKLGGQIQGLD